MPTSIETKFEVASSLFDPFAAAAPQAPAPAAAANVPRSDNSPAPPKLDDDDPNDNGNGDGGDEREGEEDEEGEEEGEGEEEEEDYEEEEYESEAGSATPPPRFPVRRGGPAARKVYATQEIMSEILECCDKSSLARMLRLEKALAPAVAKVLFRTVHTSVMKKMSRANPRRRMYCDAVRAVDRSPHPTLLPAERKFQPSTRDSVRFDPHECRKLVEAGLKKYPNLQTILYQYPQHDTDDAYTIHIRGGKISVDLEERYHLDIHDPEEAASDSSIFVNTPQYRGMTIRGTIAIFLTVQNERNYLRWAQRPEALKAHLKKWKDWLFCNAELDRRVTSIDWGLWTPNHNENERREYRDPAYANATRRVELSLDEALAFLARRKRQGCEPMTHVYIPPSPKSDPVTPDRFRQIISLLNPEIRSLRIHQTAIQNFPKMQMAIKALDAALPNLGKLAIVHHKLGGEEPKRSYIQNIPLSGMPQLRNFASVTHGGSSASEGRFMCRLGNSRTYYQDLEVRSSDIARMNNNMAHEVRPYVLERRTFRYGYMDDWVMRPEDEAHIDVRETRVESEWGAYYVSATAGDEDDDEGYY